MGCTLKFSSIPHEHFSLTIKTDEFLIRNPYNFLHMKVDVTFGGLVKKVWGQKVEDLYF